MYFTYVFIESIKSHIIEHESEIYYTCMQNKNEVHLRAASIMYKIMKLVFKNIMIF